jgi:O-antigen/teichoic acid export membrane protein
MQDDSLGNSQALTRTLARGAGVNLTGFAARLALVSLHTVLGARLYGAEAYGVYAIGVAAVIMLSLVGQLGLGRTVTRFVALHQARNEPRHIVWTLRTTLRVALPISVAVGLILSVGAEPMASLFGEPGLVSPFRILGLVIPVVTLGALLAAFTQGFQRMRYKVIALDVVSPGVELLGLVFFAWLGLRNLGLPIAYVGSAVVSSVLLIYFTKRDLHRVMKEFPKSVSAFPGISVKPVLGFAMPLWAVDILTSVTRRASVLMLGMMSTSSMVGIFSVLQRVVALGTSFLLSLNTMFGPMVANLVERREFNELERLYKIATRWSLVAGLPFCLIAGFFRAEILELFGPEFVAGSDALWFLIGAMVANLLAGSCGVVLIMSGYPHYSSLNEAVMLITVVGLNLAFIPHYGLLGAAGALAIGTVIVNTLRVVQVWWHFRIHPFSWALSKVIMAGVVMGSTLAVWRVYALRWNIEWYGSILGSGIALLAFGFVLFALGLEDSETEALQILKKRLMPTRV